MKFATRSVSVDQVVQFADKSPVALWSDDGTASYQVLLPGEETGLLTHLDGRRCELTMTGSCWKLWDQLVAEE